MSAEPRDQTIVRALSLGLFAAAAEREELPQRIPREERAIQLSERRGELKPASLALKIAAFDERDTRLGRVKQPLRQLVDPVHARVEIPLGGLVCHLREGLPRARRGIEL